MKCECNKTKWYLAGIVLLGLLARIARAVIELDIKQDAVLYMNMARLWSTQGVDAAFLQMNWIPPLWPWLLANLHSVGVEPEFAGEVIGVVMGATVIVSVFFICRQIFEKESYALAGALLVAIHPYLIRLSTVMLRDTIYIPLVACAIAIAMNACVKLKWWKWALYGVVCALAVMTRREGGELLIFLGAWSIVEMIQKRAEFKDALKRVVIANVSAFVFFLIITLPVQNELGKSECTWRIIPDDVSSNVERLLTISDDELFEMIEEK